MDFAEVRWGRVGLALLASVLLVAGVFVFGAGSSKAAAPKALILGSTVSPGRASDGDSFEQEGAEQAGFAVTVVSDSQWDSMTAAQFRSYQLLILGDPTCSGDPSSPSYAAAQSNMSVWEPQVMSSGGNKVLIGTDPVFHEGSHPGALKLIDQGIAFAGAVSGATGLYLDLSCSYDSTPAHTPVPVLDGLSTHGPHQFTAIGEGAVNACATSVNIVAATGPTAGLKDADLSNWSCSVHEAFDKFPSDYTPLALAPSGSGFPIDYCAKDVETKAQACGSPYIMVSGAGVLISSDISVAASPPKQDVGGTVTLTATVTNNGKPVGAGTKVTFSVDSGPNAGLTGTGTTDSSGHATFSYSSSKTGTDSVSATFTNSLGAQEKGTTSVVWTPGITAKAGPSLTGKVNETIGGTVATFTDGDTSGTAAEYSAKIKWGDGKSTTGTIGSTGGANFTVTGKHAYTKTGTFKITVTITDVDNAANSATVTTTATITGKKIVHGSARLSGVPAACVLRPVSLVVHGKRISSVKWSVDGSAVGGKTVHRGKQYSAKFSVSSGKHHVTVKVSFRKSSHTKARTFHRTITGCAAVLPKFTG